MTTSKLREIAAGSIRPAVLLATLLFALVANTPATADPPEWTWLFYDDADFGPAYDPLNSFANETAPTQQLQILILHDDAYGPANLYRLEADHSLTLLEELGEVDMGAAATLRDFITYGKTNYPANRYLLSMYDHGYAWRGACWDNSAGSHMTMDEMQQGLQQGGGVDILAFTAPCTMGAIEVLYELRGCAEIVIGSEDGSGYGRWRGMMDEVCEILTVFTTFSNRTVSEWIIEAIRVNDDFDPFIEYLTMSAVNTEATTLIAQTLAALTNHLVQYFDQCANDIYAARMNGHEMGMGLVEEYYLVDLYNWLGNLIAESRDPLVDDFAAQARNAIVQAVVAECHGYMHDGVRGINIFFPWNADDYAYSYETTLDFTNDVAWADLLQEFLNFNVPTAAPPGGPELDFVASPNPFRQSTTITFKANGAAGSSLDLYDVQGRRIRSFASSDGRIVWDGKDASGAAQPAGIYLAQLHRAGLPPERYKLLLLR